MKGWASCDLPALVITKIPTETGEVIDWLWKGGTVTIKWFWKILEIQKGSHILMKFHKEYGEQKSDTTTNFISGETEEYAYVPVAFYLMEKVHVNLCVSLPGTIIYK